MNTNGRIYSIAASDNRICEILDATDQGYEEVNAIPPLGRLTYTNGFYVNHCVAVFVDIRNSSQLPQSHNRPVLGKMYRAYLSECAAVLNQDPNCKQVFIHGDCVSGIFDGNQPSFVDGALFCAFQLNSLIKMLNWRLGQRGYSQIRCGIGMDYGRALMLQGGCSGTGINEIIWMGEVVNNASNLCGQGNKHGLQPIQVSTAAYERLGCEDYKRHLTPRSGGLMGIPVAYEGNVFSTEMEQWLENEQRKGASRQGVLSALSMLGDSTPGTPGGYGLGLLEAAQTAQPPQTPLGNLVGIEAIYPQRQTFLGNLGIHETPPQIPPPPTPLGNFETGIGVLYPQTSLDQGLLSLGALGRMAAQDLPTQTPLVDYNAALISALGQRTQSFPGQSIGSLADLAELANPKKK